MAHRLAVSLALLAACGAKSERRPENPKAAPPIASVRSVRSVDVGGVSVEAGAFVPARYANRTDLAVHVTREGKTTETTIAHSSFILDFAATTVTGCRGQRVSSSVDGGKASYESRHQEQQGYRGTWKTDDVWIDVELRLDNSVCPQQRRYENLEPRPWSLRCLSVLRAGLLGSAGLVCRATTHAESQFDEQYAHMLTKILPGAWIAFGVGNGLHATWSEQGVGLFTEKNAVVRVVPATAIVTTSTWEKD